MSVFRMTTDGPVRRLRWVMIGVIVVDSVNTLMGQPASYWQNPETARELNPLVRLFITEGYVPFLLGSAVYLVGTFFVVSLLPRRLALVAMFSFTLGHYFGGSTWWVFRWKLGIGAAVLYGIVLAAVIVLCGFPKKDAAPGEEPPAE